MRNRVRQDLGKILLVLFTIILLFSSSSIGLSAEEITEDDVRMYVESTYATLKFSDEVFNEAFDIVPYGYSSSFLNLFKTVIATEKVVNHLLEKGYKEAILTAGKYAAELGLSYSIAGPILSTPMAVARLAVIPIEVSLKKFAKVVNTAAWKAQADCYFNARETCDYDSIVNKNCNIAFHDGLGWLHSVNDEDCCKSYKPCSPSIGTPQQVFEASEIQYLAYEKAVSFEQEKKQFEELFLESLKKIAKSKAENCKNVKSDAQKPQATAIVFDHSGSMAEEKKIDCARDATVTYVENMEEDDLLSVSIFSNNASTPTGLKMQSKSGIVVDKLLSRLLENNPMGGTNIGAGLSKGLDQLCSIPGEKVKKDALLLSDGMNNVGKYHSIVQKYIKYKIPIHTVKFGKHASEENLKKIAKDTQGTYSDADQDTVSSAYSAIFNAINGNSAVLATHDLMGPKDKLAYQADISPDADYLNLNTSWRASRLKVLLTSPSGNTYTGSQLPGRNDRFEESKISQFTKIQNPESGIWNLDIQWDIPPTAPERVNLLLSEHTNVYTSILGFSPEYTPGQQVIINVQASELDGGNNKHPLQNASVKAKIQIPGQEMIRMIHAQSSNLRVYEDVVQDITREVELFDDGAHDDYKAGDGIFGGFFTETQINGSYIVTAQIEGFKENGTRVNRQSVSSFQVGPLLDAEVTTSQIMQYARQLEEKLKTNVVNPLGGMQSSGRPAPADTMPTSGRKKRSRSLMDKLSN